MVSKDEAEKWIFLRRHVEEQWIQVQKDLEARAEYEKRYGFTPTQGWSKPYRAGPNSKLDLPYMENTWWARFSDLTIQRAKLDARPLDTEFLFRNYLSNAIRPKSPMEWKSFNYDADTSELTRWDKGKLTRTFRGVMSGKYPLRRLTDLFDELDMDFDYEEFRRSYTKD
jgi:hypothetical protein